MDNNVEPKKSKEEILNELSNSAEPIESKPIPLIIFGVLFFIIGIIAFPYGLHELQFGYGRSRVGPIIISIIGIIGGPFMVLVAFYKIHMNKKMKDIEFEIDKRVN